MHAFYRTVLVFCGYSAGLAGVLPIQHHGAVRLAGGVYYHRFINVGQRLFRFDRVVDCAGIAAIAVVGGGDVEGNGDRAGVFAQVYLLKRGAQGALFTIFTQVHVAHTIALVGVRLITGGVDDKISCFFITMLPYIDIRRTNIRGIIRPARRWKVC